MKQEPKLQKDENLFFRSDFVVYEDGDSNMIYAHFAVSDQALYWPQKRGWAWPLTSFFRRIPKSEIVGVRILEKSDSWFHLGPVLEVKTQNKTLRWRRPMGSSFSTKEWEHILGNLEAILTACERAGIATTRDYDSSKRLKLSEEEKISWIRRKAIMGISFIILFLILVFYYRTHKSNQVYGPHRPPQPPAVVGY